MNLIEWHLNTIISIKQSDGTFGVLTIADRNIFARSFWTLIVVLNIIKQNKTTYKFDNGDNALKLDENKINQLLYDKYVFGFASYQNKKYIFSDDVKEVNNDDVKEVNDDEAKDINNDETKDNNYDLNNVQISLKKTSIDCEDNDKYIDLDKDINKDSDKIDDKDLIDMTINENLKSFAKFENL